MRHFVKIYKQIPEIVTNFSISHIRNEEWPRLVRVYMYGAVTHVPGPHHITLGNNLLIKSKKPIP